MVFGLLGHVSGKRSPRHNRLMCGIRSTQGVDERRAHTFQERNRKSGNKRPQGSHHFTLPYTPGSDGAVERLGKELLRVFRSIVSELQMRFEEWPDLLPVVQSALNNGPSPQRRDISPITSFLGRDPTPPIGTFLRTKNTETVTLGDGDRERMLNVSLLKKRVADLHPMVGMELEAN